VPADQVTQGRSGDLCPNCSTSKLSDAVCYKHVSCTLDKPKREHFYHAARNADAV